MSLGFDSVSSARRVPRPLASIPTFTSPPTNAASGSTAITISDTSVVPHESWRFPLCGFLVGGRGVLVVDGADHADSAVPAVMVVEPVAPVKHNSLRLAR